VDSLPINGYTVELARIQDFLVLSTKLLINNKIAGLKCHSIFSVCLSCYYKTKVNFLNF